MRYLLPLLALIPGAPGIAQDVPVVSAPLVGGPGWAYVPEVSGFRLTADGRLATGQPSAQVCYQKDSLRVRFRCPIPPDGNPTASQREHDGAVWNDDAVELFLDPGKTGEHSYQFIVNSRGSRYDGRDGDPGWNGEWSALSSVEPDGRSWSCEITVPFATLGRDTPKPGEQWGANFCSDSLLLGENSSWAYTGGTYDQPARFGVLQFQPDAPGIRLEGLGNMALGIAHLGVSLAAGTDQTVELSARLSSGEDAVLDEKRSVQLAAGKPQSVSFELSCETPGEHRLDVAVTRAPGGTLFASQVPVGIYPPVRVLLRGFPTPGIVEATVDATLLPPGSAPAKATVAATGPEGRRLASETVALKGAKGSAELDVSAATATISVSATVADAEGRSLGEGSATFERPPVPDWVRTGTIDADRVLRPFTPLEVAGDVARVWGRELTYRGLLLPSSITSGGSELLAGPPRWRLRSAGAVATLRLPGTTRGRDEKALVRTGQMTLQGLRFAGSQTLEYDGCIKLQVDIEPTRPVEADELIFEIPLRPEVARYLHTCRADWANSLSQAVPDDGWASKFMPFLWVGDEDRGLAWFTESDEWFSVADPRRVLEIVREGKQTVLRVRVIDKPTRLQSPLRLVFGLQPTPVKPVPARKARIWHGASYGMQDRVITGGGYLSLPAAGSIDLRRGTLQTVVTLDFDPEKVAEKKTNQTLFHLAQPNGDQVYLFWDHPERGLWFYLGLGQGYPQKYPIHLTTANLGWRKGETHHVAVTWGERTTLYLDGKQAAQSAAYDGWMAGPLTGERMAFGSDSGRETAAWVLHALRIDSEPASADEIAACAAAVAERGAATRLTPVASTLTLYHPRAAQETTTPPALQAPDVIASGEPKLESGAFVAPDGAHTEGGKGKTMLDLLSENGCRGDRLPSELDGSLRVPEDRARGGAQGSCRSLPPAGHQAALVLRLWSGEPDPGDADVPR